MVSIRYTSLAVAALSCISTVSAANTTAPVLQSGLAIPGTLPSLFGCYGSSQAMTWTGSYNYMTISICQIYCINANKPVAATSAGTDCYCGDYAPPTDAVLTSGKCSTNCTGFGAQICGGPNSTNSGVILSVYNDQLESAISNTPDTSSSSSATATKTGSTSGATSVQPAVVTVTNAAGVATTSSASASNSSGGTSTGGLIAGIVVGIIVVAAVGGGVWFFMRRKQRREVEEEHKRQVAQSSFIAGGKPESKSAQDSILDPAILRNRRESDGSIMDSQDYSRRVLRVVNDA